ncbi:hypothetical protein FT663_00971 [Candidozyma haemuli var. vulneris]|uniref:Symplekin/Pta1 N-terminal domain-containing protein n=1 Tax=Candidozyma haemuli TaxID=45357 RepID=A0A2V1AVI5_9ASCO|nr:hypothetical protein CXQ85_000785 [[Candida] haemuloni]KAF3986263.1 hypothetical protein FT662_04665 [[Candida] haemuloni var. vulneris]KAF3994866.1 hypothetical protein FT663_00971 [[Candida] haemuloni var. vulneris]PVH21794.1 hypothetical protein CXQ85_000785 [[Candida] haemuloni]
MADEAAAILTQLDQARELAFSNSDMFPQVVKQILNLVNHPSLDIQRWCALFLKKAFSAGPEIVSAGVKIDLAIDALVPVKTLAQTKDLEVFKAVIDLSITLYKLVFRYVADNDGSHNIWDNLRNLKNDLIYKFDSQFPFEPSFDKEHDQVRNLDSKLELLKLIFTVIDYQSRSVSTRYYSLARVNPSHTLIKTGPMESEAHSLLEKVLAPLQDDILVTPVITAVLNHLAVIVRRKRQFIDRVIPVLESFESNQKLQSNYESLESFKLSKKYCDRALRVLLNYMTKCQVVPPNFQNAVNRKISTLTARGDDIRKKNILESSPDDQNIKKRKYEGFENPSKKIKTLDYKHLYGLTDVSSDLNNFDLSTLPQNILVSMALTALSRADVKKLTKALEIVSERYSDTVKDLANVKTEQSNQVGGDDDEEDDDDAAENFTSETTYTVPPPKALSFQEKKDHVKMIVDNFFQLSQKGGNSTDLIESADGNVNKELTKVAIKTWNQDSWLILLTRLAARGMHTIEGDEEKSPDVAQNEELSDIIRQALFDYFLGNIHERVDTTIEWLNEEWYSERVSNEEKLRQEIEEKWQKKYEEDPNGVSDIQEKIDQEVENIEVQTPRYNKWCQKVLDAMIPFLEPTDRKIFLRMVSDLPYLNESMLGGIKSLCADPARSKLGFLSLQFLVMYRPPVKEACFNVLRQLKDSDQEDLKEEASKLLTKYGQ